MIPAVLDLAFECGADGSADFTVSDELLPITAAAAVVWREGEAGDGSDAGDLEVSCAVVGPVVQLRLTAAQTQALGQGSHRYQLDVRSAGRLLRLAKGRAVVGIGRTTTGL